MRREDGCAWIAPRWGVHESFGRGSGRGDEVRRRAMAEVYTAWVIWGSVCGAVLCSLAEDAVCRVLTPRVRDWNRKRMNKACCLKPMLSIFIRGYYSLGTSFRIKCAVQPPAKYYSTANLQPHYHTLYSSHFPTTSSFQLSLLNSNLTSAP